MDGPALASLVAGVDGEREKRDLREVRREERLLPRPRPEAVAVVKLVTVVEMVLDEDKMLSVRTMGWPDDMDETGGIKAA